MIAQGDSWLSFTLSQMDESVVFELHNYASRLNVITFGASLS